MQTAMFVLLALLVPVSALLLGFAPRGAPRRSPARSPVVPPVRRVTRALRGTSLFMARVDPWTVGVDCLLEPTPDTVLRVPVHLRLHCPMLQWHQPMGLVASMVGRWAETGVPVEIEVLMADDRIPRARLSRSDTAVVLDVENGEVLGRPRASTAEPG